MEKARITIKKDELVAEITTDHTGVARISGLPLGKYYVKEKETAHGFVLDKEAREIDLLYLIRKQQKLHIPQTGRINVRKRK